MKAIVVIGGFRESAERPTGMRKIFREAFKRHSNTTTMVVYREWNQDLRSLGRMLTSLGVTECAVAAYSWGCGHGLKEFAKGFSGRVYASLCDPVYFSYTLLGRFQAMFNRTIKFPDNVEVAVWVNQKMDEPGGDPVKAGVLPRKPRTLPYPHTQIDDSPEYKHDTLQMFRLYINKMNHKEPV